MGCADDHHKVTLSFRRQATKEEFITAMKTVETLIGNLCDHPEDPKYNRIRLQNAGLQKKLFNFDGGADAVKYAISMSHRFDGLQEDSALKIVLKSLDLYSSENRAVT